MKRLCSLLIGICILTTTSSAHALTMTPISQRYVQPVLDRIDAAILPGTQTPSYNFIFHDWIRRMATTFLELVDTELRVVEYQRDLYKITPCMHLDLIILEQKLEDLRFRMLYAFKDRKMFDIIRLQSMSRFLNDRYRHLILGGRDPYYEDPRYNWYYLFDKMTWCCPGFSSPAVCREANRLGCTNNGGIAFKTAEDCSAYPGCEEPQFLPPKERVCPFHSDYLPPTIAGYGCDVEALDAVGSGGHYATQEERDGLDAFIQERDNFLNNISFIGTMSQQIASSMGLPPPDLSRFLAALSRTHKTREGCSYTDSPAYNPPMTEFDPPPIWPEGAAKWELRGPFFLTSDELYLVRGLYDQLREWGRDRDQADYLKLPREYPPGTIERSDAEIREGKMGVIKKILRNFVRTYFGIWNLEQAGREARPVIQSGDSQKQIIDLAEPLRGTMIEFYELSSYKDKGIRKFTTKFGYFLRRTCVFRPCNKMLDRMLKINFEDACFPYVSGAFKGDTQHHETCKGAAGVGESF